MNQQAEFEIVSEAPHVDKVLFDNVLSCYDWSKKITATYTLGEALNYTTWDWVGIFRCDWRYLGDYISYRWAPQRTFDCNSPRRRSIVFPAEIQQIIPDKKDKYHLIYISSGNKVTGISPSFAIWKDDDLNTFDLMRMFKTVSVIQRGKAVKRKADKSHRRDKSPLLNYITIKTSNNQKIRHVYRDEQSLVDFTGTDFHTKLRIVEPVVREYGALVPVSTKELVGYTENVQLWDQQTASTSNAHEQISNPVLEYCQRNFDSIEFRNYLPIKTGPKSFLHSPGPLQQGCSSCLIAKDLIRDFVEKEGMKAKKLYDTSRNKCQWKTNDQSLCQIDAQNTFDYEIFEKLQDENQALREKLRELEAKLKENEKDETSDWVVFEPKRIYRMNKLVVKQGKIICELEQCVEDKSKAIINYRDETMALRKLLKSANEKNKHFQSLAEELNWKLRCLISKRIAERTNEWISIAKKLDDSGTQTAPSEELPKPSCSEPKVKKVVTNKQISKIICAEKKQPKSKLHKERKQAEQCPTCGLKFSAKADARVIQEHIVFHDRKDKMKRE